MNADQAQSQLEPEFLRDVALEKRSRRNRRILIGTIILIVLCIAIALPLAVLFCNHWFNNRFAEIMRQSERIPATIITKRIVVETPTEVPETKTRRARPETKFKYYIEFQYTYHNKPLKEEIQITQRDYAQINVGQKIEVYHRPGKPAFTPYEITSFNELTRNVSHILLRGYRNIAIVALAYGAFLIVVTRLARRLPPYRKGIRAKLQLAKTMARSRPYPPPKALFDHFEKTGINPRYWVTGELPNSPVIFLHAILARDFYTLHTRAIGQWIDNQPKPIDYENYLRHLDYALANIYPQYEALPILNIAAPEPRPADSWTVEMMLGEADPARAADPSFNGLRLGLAGLDWDLARKFDEAQWAYCTYHNRTAFPENGGPEERKFFVQEAIPESILEERFSRQRLFDGKMVDEIQFNAFDIAREVSQWLLDLRLDPWGKEPFVKTIRIHTGAGEEIPLRVSFDPRQELRIECLAADATNTQIPFD